MTQTETSQRHDLTVTAPAREPRRATARKPDVRDPQLEGSRTTARRANERLVLNAIFHHGPVSRVKVASIAGLSKPTVSSIVDDLVRAGVVQPFGRRQGRVGRSATLFHVDGSVAYAAGVDLGGSYTRIVVADIHGNMVGEQTTKTDLTSPQALERQIVQLSRGTADSGVPWKRVRAITIGVPGAVDELTCRVRLAPNIPAISGVRLREQLADSGARSVVLENDVNLAAVSEHRHGLAREIDNFVFIEVGTGLGAGIVIDGRLCRGARGGAAGEIGYLPIGDDPFAQRHHVRGALEEQASGPGIALAARRRVQAGEPSILPADCEAVDVFSAAAQEDPLALEIVDQAARYLALGIASVAMVIAPELVILGGGVGASPQLLAPVRRYVQQLLPEPLRIEQTDTGIRATLVGALATSLAAARETVLSLNEGSAVELAVPRSATVAI